MSEILVPGILDRGTEFVVAYDPVTRTTARRFGTCGPRALASVLSNALNRHIACADVYTSMRGAAPALCDVSGASTIGGLQAEAGRYNGASIVAVQPYGEPWTSWSAYFQAHAGVHPFLYETAHGQALVDAISGLGENAVNLVYHFLAVLGRNTGGWSPLAQRTLPAGYWCADGDNFAGGNNSANGFNAANVLQFYPDDVIGASQPCAALALKTGGVPQMWTADGNGAKDSVGHTVGTGLASALIGHSAPDGTMSETAFNGAGDVYVTLTDGEVYTWTHQEGARTDRGGLVIEAQKGDINTLNAEISTLKAELAAVPPPAPALTPYQLAAIAATEAELAAQSALASAAALKGK